MLPKGNIKSLVGEHHLSRCIIPTGFFYACMDGRTASIQEKGSINLPKTAHWGD